MRARARGPEDRLCGGSGPDNAPVLKEDSMKGARTQFDLGALFDDIFEAARDITDSFKDFQFEHGPFAAPWNAEGVDFYPNYSYPPMNFAMARDRTLIFEFALAGFDEKDISLSFQGDYMVFEAKAPVAAEGSAGSAPGGNADNGLRYFKRRLKMKDIERQKYYVPADKFEQTAVKAAFRNGILRVTVPARAKPEATEGVKIPIVNEDA